jgi:hypothetical protein
MGGVKLADRGFEGPVGAVATESADVYPCPHRDSAAVRILNDVDSLNQVMARGGCGS